MRGHGYESAQMQTVVGGAQAVNPVVALLRRLDASAVADLRDFTP